MPSQHRPQMQHFIPRFILRQFAPTDQPPASPSTYQGEKNGKRKNRKTRRDFLLNKLDLSQSALTQRPVSTEYALADMYRDPGFDENPNHLERKLGDLEGQASNILHRACDAFSQNSTLKLRRYEKDTLRKFLFLMKYRNTGFFHRYNHDRVETYSAGDRDIMEGYMRVKGFTKPRDVWFDNLRGLLDLEMDAERLWIQKIQAQVYPDDAKLFILHVEGNFLAFCKPGACEEEFLLTENSYCVFEGPSNPTLNLLSGDVAPGIYTEYHNFAPISQRLIIVLQSVFLRPLAGDGVPQQLQTLWKDIGSAMRASHLYPDSAGSILQDIPIQKCGVSYMSTKDSNLKLTGMILSPFVVSNFPLAMSQPSTTSSWKRLIPLHRSSTTLRPFSGPASRVIFGTKPLG